MDDWNACGVIFHWFRPIRYRIQFQSFNQNFSGAVAALYPYNSQYETFTPSGFSAQSLADMKGAVVVQPTYSNIGKWVKWPRGQQMYSVQETNLGSGTNLILGYLLFANPAAGACSIMIQVDLLFKERNPFTQISVPAMESSESSAYEDVSKVDEEENKVDLRRLSIALRRLNLMHDVEPNPGPKASIFYLDYNITHILSIQDLFEVRRFL